MPRTAMNKMRMYQELARELLTELASGRFPVGARMPAERVLALQYNVSRPTVREAIISLEVKGLIEVRVGSGAYVRRLPNEESSPCFNISAFELTEARMLFEGEAAALAATMVSDDELAEIEWLADDCARGTAAPEENGSADRAFHFAIARVTRNEAIYHVIERLWDLHDTSHEIAMLQKNTGHGQFRSVVDDHNPVTEALRARNPVAARAAMREHLIADLDGLLIAAEERTIDEARKAVRAKRERYMRAMT